MTFIIQQLNIIEGKLTTLDSKLFQYLFSSESRTYFITSSSSSLIMISMLSLSECITHSSS